MLHFLVKLVIKVLTLEGEYLKRKLMLIPVVYGPEGRTYIAKTANLQNSILNTSSGTITIGEYSFFGHDCMVLTGTHRESARGLARINDHPTTGRDIVIGAGVWVGSRAIILGGVSIADNVIIGANSVVTQDCREEGVYAGTPARRVRSLKEFD